MTPAQNYYTGALMAIRLANEWNCEKARERAYWYWKQYRDQQRREANYG